MIALPDVNVLLALAWEQHVHHNAAHTWFQQAAPAGWATCLLTQTGFLRLSMNPQVVHATTDCQTAWELLAGLTSHGHHRFVAETPSLTEDRFGVLAPRIAGHNQMTDATLLFFARTQGLKLVSFDRALSALCPWTDSLEVLSS